jgi:hypothetical protein
MTINAVLSLSLDYVRLGNIFYAVNFAYADFHRSILILGQDHDSRGVNIGLFAFYRGNK